MKKFMFFLISIACICSCTIYNGSEGLTTVDNSNPIKIKIDSDNSRKDLKTSQIIDDVKVVRFNLPDKVIMAGIDKLLYHEGKIIVLDNLTASVFIFELNGNFLFRINSTGYGPGEYIAVDDIGLNISKEEILILDLRRFQVLRFSMKNAEYLGSTRFSFFTFNMSQLNKDTRVFYNAHIPNGLVDSINVSSSSVFLTDNNNNILRSLFPLKNGQEKVALITRFGLFQNYSKAGGINYVPLYDNRVYHINDDVVRLSYVIDSDYEFANEQTLTNYTGTMERWMSFLDQNNLAFNLTDFWETEEHATFNHKINGKTRITIYDKDTKESSTYSMTGLKDDLGIGVIKPMGIINGYFATVLTQEYFNKKNLMLSQENSKISDPKRNYLKEFTTDRMSEDLLLTLVKFKRLDQ